MIAQPAPATQWEGQPVSAWAGRLRVPRLDLCDVVSSTSDVIRERAADGAPAGTLCVAERQTHGRGQHGRGWNDAPGASLLLSMLFRPGHVDDAALAPGALPLRVGLAIAQAIQVAAGIQLRVKWPNDIVTPSGAKVGGVLCEGVNTGCVGGYVVVGAGINVRQQRADFPPELQDSATSVAMMGGADDRAALLEGVAQRLLACATAPLSPLSLHEQALLERLDLLRGREITVDDGTCVSRVIAAGIEPDGALRVAEDGVLRMIRSGTVRLANRIPERVP